MLEKDKILMNEWVCKSLEGDISDAECDLLQTMLSSGPEVLQYYSTCLQINRGLVKIKPILKDSLSMDLCLQEMATYENQAEVIAIKPSRPEPEKVTVRKLPPQSHRASRLSLYVAISSTAALLLLLLYVYINPRPISQEVAVLTDSIDASWANPDEAVKNGSRLMTGLGPSTLKTGIIKLRYDDGVQVVIEAPAEYELLTSTEIALRYGKVFASVTEAGKGFTVSTANSRIIDLGTEFGVFAGTRGDTQLHVFKGMTTLIAGLKNTEKELLEVQAGQARQVDVYNAGIRAIQLDQNSFARSIDSQTNTVWRGETTIDLAAALNGRLAAVGAAGAALLDDSAAAVNTLSLSQAASPDALKSPGFFLPIQGNPYINGVFLANGADGPISVAADGSAKWNAPVGQVRQKIGLLRFDISSIKGDRTGASLGLAIRGMVGEGRPIAVYGLLNEAADNWSEKDIHYANAPGFRPAPLGRYDMDPAAWKKLGTLAFNAAGDLMAEAVHLDLDAFIAADKNNLLTLALLCENSDTSAEWRITTKEGDPSQAPWLVFPCGDSSDVVITTVTDNGADTYLSNDNQYDTINTTDPHGRETSLRVRHYWKDVIAITSAASFEYKDDQGQSHTCRFRLDSAVEPLIALKTGAGITFDLTQMQNRVPENRPARLFTAQCGMPQGIQADGLAGNNYKPSIDVYVLVDGKLRLTRTDVNPATRSFDISVPLTSQDRYLTLAVTGASDQRTPLDWGLFANPRILFE
ncbi:MAG: FecR family protein [Planctomycetaceae bacterium]|nr:FecR family protein [Planctomycetaceae bacterium]